MVSGDAFSQSFEQFRNQRLKLRDLTNFEHFQQLSQKHGFFSGVSEGPILQEALDELGGQLRVLAQEKHRAPEKLLVVEVAGLDFVEGNDD